MSAVFLALFFDLVWFREQFCAFLCPYARFQSVLISVATPTVAYDYRRGDPRGKRDVKGDCIDCGLCVRVCPTGIDIRQGLQLECIQCMRCSDACDTIMSSLKREPGLIRKASKMEIDQGPIKKKFRVRPLILFLMFLSSVIVLSSFVLSRDALKVTMLRQAKSTFTVMDDGRIANYFSLRVVNQSRNEQLVKVSTKSGAQIICSLSGEHISSNQEVTGILIVLTDRQHPLSEIAIDVDDGATLQLALLHP